MNIPDALDGASPGRPLGLPLKEGVQLISDADWYAMQEFVASKVWQRAAPACPADLADPLLVHELPYGAFMLGFDFHLSAEGPRLIEINTNAGGLATTLQLSGTPADRAWLWARFAEAVRTEYAVATGRPRPRCVAIVDEHVTGQGLFPEMALFARVLTSCGMPTVIVCPDELVADPEGALHVRATDGDTVDLIYSRLVDFRLLLPEHAHLRRAAVAGLVVLTPHPASYVRVADKRNLGLLQHALVPETMLLTERPLEAWRSERKAWVFKPVDGNASHGVYRGDKISVAKLESLDRATTIAQRYCAPGVAADGTKFDVRVYTHGATVLALASRHFSGQVPACALPDPSNAPLQQRVFCCTVTAGYGNVEWHGGVSTRAASWGMLFSNCFWRL